MKAHEAKTEDTKMSYNERQLYVQNTSPNRRLHDDQNVIPTTRPSRSSATWPGTERRRHEAYSPAEPPEQARQWLFDWVKEPRHYSEYTVMPRLRLSDQQAMDLTEYLLGQKRTNDKPGRYMEGRSHADRFGEADRADQPLPAQPIQRPNPLRRRTTTPS